MNIDTQAARQIAATSGGVDISNFVAVFEKMTPAQKEMTERWQALFAQADAAYTAAGHNDVCLAGAHASSFGQRAAGIEASLGLADIAFIEKADEVSSWLRSLGGFGLPKNFVDVRHDMTELVCAECAANRAIDAKNASAKGGAR